MIELFVDAETIIHEVTQYDAFSPKLRLEFIEYTGQLLLIVNVHCRSNYVMETGTEDAMERGDIEYDSWFNG